MLLRRLFQGPKGFDHDVARQGLDLALLALSCQSLEADKVQTGGQLEKSEGRPVTKHLARREQAKDVDGRG